MQIKGMAIAVFCLSMTGCGGCSRVSAGYVGVKSTLAGSGRGLSDVAVGPAWVFYNPFTEDILEYPTFVQTAVWTMNTQEGKPINEEITFTTKDSLQVNADISLAYSLQPEKVPQFYIKFRSDDLNTFTFGFLRNMAREKFDAVAGRYGVEQVMGDNAPFLGEVRKSLQDELAPIGVHIDQFGFIGAPRPPKGVIDSINAKVQATQLALQKQNEVMQATADAAKAVAVAKGEAEAITTRADAQATANRKLAESLSPTFVEYQKILKWNGQLSQVSGSNGTIISLAPSK
jgi:regulator of protease activity HflC (stomatin/prohibitin superfamily)